jgi:hypothetical protein
MNTCCKCGSFVQNDGTIDLLGVTICLPVACDSCAAEAERDRVRRDALARWERAEREMLLPPNARIFMRPPGDLIARNPVAWEAVRGWDRARNLFLWGGEGVGKSSAAKYALGRAVLDGCEVAFLPCTKIERELWQAAKVDVLERAQRADVLVLDDLTNAPWTARGIGTLRDLIDVQHERAARVIVTANHSPADTQRHLERAADGTFVQSMLARLHPVTVCEMRGNSYRKELSK